MTRDEQEKLARSRFTVLSALRAAGVVLMLIGMWIWWGNAVRPGGDTPIGFSLFAIGFAMSLIVPQILVGRWRTPPRR